MICPRCGVESHERAKFCSECGLQLRAARPDEGTIAYQGGLRLSVDAGATILAPLGEALPADPSATLATSPRAPGLPAAPPDEAARLGAPIAGVDGATVPGVPPGLTVVGSASPPGSRRLTPPPEDGTRLASDAGFLEDATTLGTPPAEALRVDQATPPAARRFPPALEDGTRLASDAGFLEDATTLGTPSPEGRRLTTRSGRIKARGAAGGDIGPLEVGQQFGRYVIIRLLGLGGMGAVYQAWDEELEVAVAVKVIRPEVTADPSAAQELERRFKRELLLARQVTHKNVVRIHDLGELEGIKYITMSYVHGTDLATILQREGRLPVPQALKIMRGVVSGLVAAHDAGVVHRDLKPANIMVEEGSDDPLIMDFGIARSASTPAAREGQPTGAPDFLSKTPSALTDATMAGAVVGTIGYMAPEQARAQEVDQRADIYSLGLIFYDTLLGPKRFEGGLRPIEELKQRLEQAPPSPRSVEPAVPEPVDEIITRCLAPDPAERFQTTAELASALARLDDAGYPLPVLRRLTARHIAAAAMVTVSLMGTTYWLTRPPPPRPELEPVSVLVTDFANRTNDPVFSGTVEHALGVGLEGASFITAFPRRDAARLAEQLRPGSRLDEAAARLVAAREGVKVIVTGTIEPRGAGYDIGVRALDPGSDKVLAEESTTAASKAAVLGAVGTLAAELRGDLGDTASESARLDASETVTASSLEALQAYTRAQELADANQNQEALKAYQQTVELDPEFGRAYAGMGVVYTILKDEARAKAAYDEALKRVGRMTEREKLRTFGTYYLNSRNYEKAIENYQALVDLYPADDGGHGNLALAYLYTGNVKRALEGARRVLQIYPSQWAQRYNYAMYSMYAGDFQTATSEGARVIKEAPTFELAFLPVALSALARGDPGTALATYDQLEQVSPSAASLARLGRADAALYRGRYREASTVLRAGMAIDQKEGNTGRLAQGQVAAAEAYLGLGRKRAAVEAARKAVSLSAHESVLVPAALSLVQAGRPDEAERIAVTLENTLQTHAIAYARLITAQVAVSRGRYAEAIEGFRDSIKRRDTWFARFLLGRLYAEAGRFPEAMAELDICVKRQGEVTDVFFYDTPSLRYLPPAFYWLARAQQAMGVADARRTFERFIALRGDADPPDPLAVDAARRLAN